MRELAVLLLPLVTTCVRLVRPGGARSILAESLLLKHPLLILNRTRQRAPRLQPVDRIVAALCATVIRPTRLLRCAIILRPSTIMTFHRVLVYRERLSGRLEYRSPRSLRIPSLKGESSYS